ncbi:MAG: acyloxyacyl hydrolase [Pyrinomonadaceae bacterium]
MKTPAQSIPRRTFPLALTRLIRSAVGVLAIILASAQIAAAQTENVSPESTDGIQKGWNEFGIWGGISFNAPTLIGFTPDARFGNIGLRYGRVLAASKTVAFEYTIDAVPVAILSNHRLLAVGPGVFTLQRESVYGAGLAPIGLKFNFRRNKRVQPFAASTGGFLYFQRDVPVSGAAQFNFTFDFAGGVQIVNSNRRAFTIGYKFEHISNGYHSPINPGVDVHMVTFGYSIFR